jgi:transketolase
MLHLWGYGVEMEDLKQFRQLGSKTPGHPECTHTDGIEVTTGPLGQGVANAVGFAMAGLYAKNAIDTDAFNHKVYCFCGDGDLEEGISYEACSVAGHLNLNNLVLIYDSNNITIEGDTAISISEDIQMRFEAQKWEVTTIDGHNFDAIDAALTKARTQTKPLLIIAKTKIGKGAATMEGSHHTHGAPLGSDELAKSKQQADFAGEVSFFVSDDVMVRFRSAIDRGDLLEREWNAATASLKATIESYTAPDFTKIEFPEFKAGESHATRDTNGKILNAVAKALPGFLGGSADLAPSNKTELSDMGDFPTGKNLHFGIREHSMAAITSGIAAYGLFLPFCATFFIFSDYLKPAARVAALMKAKLFYVFTHDSIGVGEDGATHQPVEQLTTFRAMPGFYTFRPADGIENVENWKTALTLQAPSAFVCSRQKLPVLERSKSRGDVAKGGYLISEVDEATVTLIATGSEVEIALKAQSLLDAKGVKANVVSVPCFDLFVEQEGDYIDTIINPSHLTVAVEAASGIEWYRFADAVVGMNSFGESAPAEKLYEHFGITAEAVVETVAAL